MAPIPPDTPHAGRHEWNTFENYGHINDRKLTEHPFVDHAEVTFEEIVFEGDLFIAMEATVHCPDGVILEVTKVFETKRMGQARGASMSAHSHIDITLGSKASIMFCGTTIAIT